MKKILMVLMIVIMLMAIVPIIQAAEKEVKVIMTSGTTTKLEGVKSEFASWNGVECLTIPGMIKYLKTPYKPGENCPLGKYSTEK